jgi:uncharacterized protein with beta-barrel porin domain
VLNRSSIIRAYAVVAVSSSALTPISAWAGPDACTENPVGTLTCSGNQSAGIVATNPTTDTLRVIGLTQGIASASGVAGISLVSTGDSIAIISDGSMDGAGGPFGIATINRPGVFGSIEGPHSHADGVVSLGDVTIENNRDIRTIGPAGLGISARIFDTRDVDHHGEISGGNIVIDNAASVFTSGNDSHGIFAVSAGLVVVENGADAAIANFGTISITGQDITTEGQSAHGIHAEAFAYVIHERNGDAQATTGADFIAAHGTISTLGQDADGIFVQIVSTAVSSGGAATASNGILTVESEEISTQGDQAAGIYAQIFTQAVSFSEDAEATAQAVQIAANGPISTLGANAYGIYIGSDARADSGNSGQGTAAAAHSIKVDSRDIQTQGTGAHAIYVNSYSLVAGSGPTSSTASDIFINSTGTVSARGADADGILAISLAEGSGTVTNGDIAVNVLAGSVSGGSGAGAGVYVFGGANNTITNAGTISALSGTAVLGFVGDETISNLGLIIGNVELGAGTNAFNNEEGGTYRSGAIAALGAGNTLTNKGVITPGGSGVIATTAITGNFAQTASGTYAVDINAATSAADLLTVSGAADLAGTIVALPQNLSSGVSQFLILSAAAGVTDHGVTAQDTAAVDYSVWFDPNGDDVYLVTDINFFGSGALNANQSSIAANLNAVTAGGVPVGLAPVTNALTQLPTQGALAAALDQVSPEIYNYAKIETLFSAEQFSSDLLSCRVNDGSGATFIREGQCIWARARARQLDLDGTSDNIGADATIGSFSGGAQVAFADDWRLGVAVGYDNVSLDMGTGAAADGDRANVGAVVKYNPGRFLFAAAVSGGWTDYDVSRSMAFGGFAATANGDASIDYVAGRLHGAYLISQGDWYLKPQIDATFTNIELDGFAETGGGGAALRVHGSNQNVFAISPAVEIGGQLQVAGISALRPFVRAGVTWRDGDNFSLDAGFEAAPADGVGFATNTAVDEVLADVSAGFDIINNGGAVLRLQYDGRFGDETSQNGASIKGSVPF